MLIVGIIIKLESSGPIFYVSKRIGKHNKIFLMPKFRTMDVNTPEIETSKFNKKNKITSLGKYLRKFSIDELPQIISILKGDMSIVGPRPALFNQKELIKKRTKLGINKLVPGLTGLAQINVRDSTDWQSKFDYDCYYVSNISLLLDLKIFFKTLKLLFNTIFLKKDRRIEIIDYKKNFMNNYANK